MKNKAFTLAELIGVIVILGVLSVIVVGAVNNSLKENKEALYQLQIDNIITGAKTWASSNVFDLPDGDGEYVIITLSQLQQSGFVEKNITNPITKEPFNKEMEIKITKIDNNYKYEIVE